MSNLTHLFKIGQVVKCKFDNNYYTGTVKETYPDHIIVDVPEVGLKMDSIWIVYSRYMTCSI